MSDSKSTIPIPKQFFNSETQQPFENCLMCSQSLKQKQYVVEKAIRNYPSLASVEIIFEYAMCLQCATQMHMELSEESRGRIETYMSQHLQNNSRSKENQSLDDSLSRCMVKDTDISQSPEYSIYALCDGSEMVIHGMPYAISGEVQDEIMQLLSAKSLDILDDFLGNHFSGPPEVRDILKRRPVLI